MLAAIVAPSQRVLARLAFALALLASFVVAAAPASLAHAQTMSSADIVDTAVAAGNFTTLATALTAAGLVDTLKGSGPFTVFAPTDAAFAAPGRTPRSPSSRRAPSRACWPTRTSCARC